MTKPTHSRLGASSSDRWTKCAGSIRLSANVPNHESVYAAEGTAAHALAEHCLRCEDEPETLRGWWIGPEGAFKIEPPEKYKPGTWFEVDAEMIDAVQVYVDYVRGKVEPDDDVEFEVHFDLSHLHPDFRGTADSVIYKPATRHLIVVDYKHGKGVPVEAVNNPQLLYYGLGAATTKHNRGVETVEIVVVQPRCPHPAGPVRTWEADAVDLVEHAAGLISAAAKTAEADAPLVAGSHCKFCPAAHFCPGLRDKVLEVIDADIANSGDIHLSDPTKFTPAMLARTLDHAGMVKDWLKRLEDYAHHEHEAGRLVPGYKMVAGRATRFFANEAEAKTVLTMEFELDEADIMTTPELRSPAQVEKLLPAKDRKRLKGLIDSKSNTRLLVRDSDPRPALAGEATSEFDAVEVA